MTVESVKEKLWKKCGTSVDSMRLELYDDAGVKVCDVNNNSRPLGFYSAQDGLVSFSFLDCTEQIELIDRTQINW